MAYSFEEGGIYYDVSGTTATVTYLINNTEQNSVAYKGDIVIPETVVNEGTEYTVNAINDNAFSGCAEITSITIPSTVRKIGNYSFNGCSGLVSINIPNQITEIGIGAFYGCSSIATITIPGSVKTIGNLAFAGCTAIKKLRFESGTSSLSLGANTTTKGQFYDCPVEYLYLDRDLVYATLNDRTPFSRNASLKDVEVGPSTSVLNYGLFHDCINLQSVRIGENVAAMGDNVFYNCICLESLYIGKSLKTIGNSVFALCENLATIDIAEENTNVSYSDGILAGAGRILWVKKGLSGNITMPDGVEQIDSYAFSGCSELASISLPEGLKLINEYAFNGCSALTSISIPGTVTTIGMFAFNGCSSLEEFRLEDGTEELGLWDNTPDNMYSIGLLYNCPIKTFYLGRNVVPKGRAESPFISWTNHGFESLTSVTIGNCVDYIGNRFFRGCSNLISVTFVEESTLKSIEASAFAGTEYSMEGSIEHFYPAFTEFDIPETVETIGGSAFKNCTSLSKITIPDNVQEIVRWTFKGCTGLTSVHIGKGVSNIGEESFSECTSLESVTFGQGSLLTNIDQKAFYGCTNMKSFEMPDNIEKIGASVFSGCSSLTAINLPNTLTVLGNGVFSHCSSLPSVSIPTSVNTIGSSAFRNCTGLNGVYITDLNAWCDIAFGDSYDSNPLYCGHDLYLNNSKVQRLIIPDDITEIKQYAFSGSSIVSVTIPSNVTSIGDGAFRECSQLLLTKFAENSKLTDIGEYAFYKCNVMSSISIPEPVEAIGKQAFANCTQLSSVKFADNAVLTNIASSAFMGCSNLTTITIPSNTETIASGAFENSGFVSVILSEGIKTVGSNAFYKCFDLESITIPSTLTYMGTAAFMYCHALNAVHISDLYAYCNITYGNAQDGGSGMSWGYEDQESNPLLWANNLYLNGEIIKDLVIPEGITKINMFAFWGGSCFKSITIPEGVTEIGYMAFAGCDSVETVHLPSSVTAIGKKAFYANGLQNGCRSICYDGNIAQWLNIDFYEYWSHYGWIYYQQTNQKFYIQGEQLAGHLDIPEGINAIGPGALFGCKDITSVTIPSTVETIDANALQYCSNLKNIYARPVLAPDLGNGSLGNCTALANIYISPEDEELTVLSYESKWSDYKSLLRVAPSNMNVSGEQTAESIQEQKAAYSAINDVDLTYVDLKDAVLDKSVTSETLKDGDVNDNVLYYLPSGTSDITGDNIVVDGIASSVVLTDKQAFGCPDDFTAGTVTYSRSYEAKLSTMYLPFAMTESQLEGLTVLRFKGLSSDGGSFEFEPVTSTEANMPYLVYANNGDKQLPEIVNVKIESGNGSMAMTSGPQFVGTYEKRVLESTADEAYYIFYNDMFYKVGSNVTVHPFRAFVKLPAASVSSSKQAYALSIANGEVTAISDMDVLSCRQYVNVFSTDGRLLRKNIPLSDATKSLNKGIYIVNGNKVTVK